MRGKLLLLSNSTNPEQPFLEHAREWIDLFFKNAQKILYIPYALVNPREYDEHTEKTALFFHSLGIEVVSIHQCEAKGPIFDTVDGIFVNGGNTFQLLQRLQQEGLLEIIQEKVKNGLPYLGSSAGTTICGPSIKTTNDMPVVEVASFNALNLTGFQITALPPYPPHLSETRDERINEFHAVNDTEVIGLREGSALHVHNEVMTVLGPHCARQFRKGQPTRELSPGSYLYAPFEMHNKNTEKLKAPGQFSMMEERRRHDSPDIEPNHLHLTPG
ncbi:MAG: dipeptidase PepE [Tatlockia sp.]|jgi:dipeptidase E